MASEKIGSTVLFLVGGVVVNIGLISTEFYLPLLYDVFGLPQIVPGGSYMAEHPPSGGRSTPIMPEFSTFVTFISIWVMSYLVLVFSQSLGSETKSEGGSFAPQAIIPIVVVALLYLFAVWVGLQHREIIFPLSVPAFAIALIALLTSSILTFVALSFMWAAILSLPRSIIYLTTRHPAREVWKRGLKEGKFEPGAVEQALGGSSGSATQARALRLDIDGLTKEARETVAAMRVEKERLKKGIEDDIERAKREAELSRLMGEFEELKIQIDILSKHKQGR
jgi:hypothetical protein